MRVLAGVCRTATRRGAWPDGRNRPPRAGARRSKTQIVGFRNQSVIKPDWWSAKDYAILKAVEAFGAVESADALDKILYFANLKRRAFRYQWCMYGICSTELSYKIAEHEHYSFDKAGAEHGERGLSLSARGSRLLGGECHAEIDSAVEWAHDLLDGMSSRQMSLLASAHFIAPCGEPSKVPELMLRITPAADFTADEVAWAMQFLENRGLLEPAPDAEPARMPA